MHSLDTFCQRSTFDLELNIIVRLVSTVNRAESVLDVLGAETVPLHSDTYVLKAHSAAEERFQFLFQSLAIQLNNTQTQLARDKHTTTKLQLVLDTSSLLAHFTLCFTDQDITAASHLCIVLHFILEVL